MSKIAANGQHIVEIRYTAPRLVIDSLSNIEMPDSFG
jgi:hypothetical protein